MSEPRRCPWCHGDECDLGENGEWCWVFCPDCGMQGPIDKHKEDAISIWNNLPRVEIGDTDE